MGAEASAIGVDLIPLERLSRVLTRSPQLFRRVCAHRERLEWTGPEGGALAWSAALWVTKEASVKCLGTGFWRQGVDWPHVDVGGERVTQAWEDSERTPSADVIWGGWAPWLKVGLSGPIGELFSSHELRCCALLQGDVAWGFAYLVAPNHV